MKIKNIGKVKLDYSYYDPSYIYNEGDDVEELILETVKKQQIIRNMNKL